MSNFLDTREENLTRNPQVFTDEEISQLHSLKADAEGFVSLGDIANWWLGEQSQYVARHLYQNAKSYDIPYLGENINFTGRDGDYHSFRIQKQDVVEFIVRLRNARWTNFLPCR